MHKKAHEIEDDKSSGNNGNGDNDAILGEEGKFKELASEWDKEGAGHDADNSKNQSGAERVKGFGNPINKIEVDGESNKD